MMPFILQIADANTTVGVASSFVNSMFGGDTVLLGIGFFLIIAAVLLIAKTRASGVVAVGIGIAYFLSLFNPAFQFIFWLGVIAGVFMLIMGLRKTTTQ